MVWLIEYIMKPLLINNLNFSKNHQHISGEIPVTQLNRLMEDDVSKESLELPPVKYILKGTNGDFHLPSLHLEVTAVLPGTCQRCLEVMQLPIDSQFDYVLSAEEPEAFDGDEDIDWLEISEEMDLIALIEDELLMAYPLGPTHTEDCQEQQPESTDTHQPFANLKEMLAKKRH